MERVLCFLEADLFTALFAIRYNNLTQSDVTLSVYCGVDCGAGMADLSQPVRKKAAKGSVVTQVFRDRLRLCWTFAGKRHYLYLGLPDSLANRKVAEIRAKQIELDIASDNFDRTLEKYKSSQQRGDRLTASKLFERFTKHKAKRLEESSLQKYRALAGHVAQFFGGKPAAEVRESQAEDFKAWLSKKLALITLKEWLGLLKAAWDWGLKQLLVTHNPWAEVVRHIKVPPQQKSKPFTLAEIEQILAGFAGDRCYRHYLDFVEFLLGTGCRTGEAIGLCWKHLSDDCSAVWIGESLTRGKRKATKTNRARMFGLSPRLQKLLIARKPEGCKPDDLVFPAPKGGAIDDHNFRNRAWVKVLSAAGVPYRKPYTTRGTFESHAIVTHKLNPLNVAEMTGHDPKILFKHYAGSIDGGLQAPDITSRPGSE